MPTVTYPDNSGLKFDFTSIELDLDGNKFVGITEVTYSDALEPGKVRGLFAHDLGTTRGEYSAEGSMKILKEELPDLLDLLTDSVGRGYMERQFTLTVSYQEPDKLVQTDRLIGCRITKIEDSHSPGGDALEVSCDLYINRIERDGNVAITKIAG